MKGKRGIQLEITTGPPRGSKWLKIDETLIVTLQIRQANLKDSAGGGGGTGGNKRRRIWEGFLPVYQKQSGKEMVLVYYSRPQKHHHRNCRTHILDPSGFTLINMSELSTLLQIYKYPLSETNLLQDSVSNEKEAKYYKKIPYRGRASDLWLWFFVCLQ